MEDKMQEFNLDLQRGPGVDEAIAAKLPE